MIHTPGHTIPIDASWRDNSLLRVAGGLVAVALVLQLRAHAAVPLLRYERGLIQSGEIWRLVTGHLVHLGWWHLCMNAAALALVSLLLGDQLRTGEWIGVVLTSSLAVGLGLLAFDPALIWYVGLSGMTHGLITAGCLTLTRRSPAWGLVGLALLASKVAWEQLRGAMPGTEALIGGTTVVDAHLYGAVGGVIAALIISLPSRRHA
jgi:rhomboid family GlyGly-CTERM serine protease